MTVRDLIELLATTTGPKGWDSEVLVYDQKRRRYLDLNGVLLNNTGFVVIETQP